jgi:hypothetical protein
VQVIRLSIDRRVGFSDRSAFITVLRQLLAGYSNPLPFLGSAQALVVPVDVFYGPWHTLTSSF